MPFTPLPPMTSVTYQYEYESHLRVCCIGCGGHSVRNIFPTFKYAPVHLAAVCDLSEKRARDVGTLFGAERFYTNHLEMLEEEKPDAVFIVTNYDDNGRPRYPELAIAALEMGAHVWIEKPPASSVGEVQRMQEVSTRTGHHVGVGLKKMFFPANRKALEIIRREEFGQVTSITARYPQVLPLAGDRSTPLKMMGFLDHMVHPHSVLNLFCGELEWLFINRDARSGASQVSLRFKSGAVGNLHFAHGIAGSSPLERTEVVGEGSNLVIDNNLRLTYYRKSPAPAYGRGPTSFGQDEHAPLHWEPEFSLGQLHNKGLFLLGYAPEIIEYTTGLLEGRGPTVGTLDDALEMMKIYEAYQRGGDEQVIFV